MIDGLGCRRRQLAQLVPDIVQEGGLGQGLFGDGGGLMRARPPAEEMEEIVGITAQRGIGHATDSLLVEESIDPGYFPAELPEYAKGTAGVAQTVLLSYTESHKEALSNSWRKS